eukprot:gene9240-biopygen12203
MWFPGIFPRGGKTGSPARHCRPRVRWKVRRLQSSARGDWGAPIPPRRWRRPFLQQRGQLHQPELSQARPRAGPTAQPPRPAADPVTTGPHRRVGGGARGGKKGGTALAASGLRSARVRFFELYGGPRPVRVRSAPAAVSP